ncbi:MAG: bifunctional nuclease family protein [Armatimonadetes bacterium]|nr:bifunctional nuclease family protein [Armatimonadota bacterium]
MKRRSDSELVHRARAGDRFAFDELVEQYGGMARRIAREWTEDDDLAGELAQEAMVHAYLSLAQLREPERFGSWLHGIVSNVCRNHHRSIRAVTVAPEMLEILEAAGSSNGVNLADTELDPYHVIEGRELHRRAEAAMQTLTEADRAAAQLFYFEQWSVQEIARALGISVAAVKVRLHKARKQLRERLSPLYPEMMPSGSGRTGGRAMIRVQVTDVMESPWEMNGMTINSFCLALREEGGDRALVIWIGQPEATAIAMRLQDLSFRRPMTFYFITSLLEAAGAKVEAAEIVDLKDETFYAVAKLRTGKRVREVDARPSDVIALALHAGCPISVSEAVMEQAGMTVPADRDLVGVMGEQLGREVRRVDVAMRQQVIHRIPDPEEAESGGEEAPPTE